MLALPSDVNPHASMHVCPPGIYFWRPDSHPCTEFTEHLTKVYQQLWKEGKAFEVRRHCGRGMAAARGPRSEPLDMPVYGGQKDGWEPIHLTQLMLFHYPQVAFLVSDKSMFDAFVADGGMPWTAIVCSGPKRSALTKKFGIKTV